MTSCKDGDLEWYLTTSLDELIFDDGSSHTANTSSDEDALCHYHMEPIAEEECRNSLLQ